MKGLAVLITMISVVALVPVQVQAFSPADEMDETECKAESILDSVTTVAGLDDEDQPLFPTYEPCVDVEGQCVFTEDVSTSVGVDLEYHWFFYSRPEGFTIDQSVDVVTELSCEGTAEVLYLHHGGTGIRGAQTLVGSYGTSTETLLGPGWKLEPEQDEDHCTYLAQYDACVTRHSGEWSLLKTFDGSVIASSGSVSVCSSSIIKNSDDAPNVAVLEDLGITFSGEQWSYSPCDSVPLPPAQMG